MIQRGKGFFDWYKKSNGEELAHEIVSMGYPTVDYLLPDLFVWLECIFRHIRTAIPDLSGQ